LYHDVPPYPLIVCIPSQCGRGDPTKEFMEKWITKNFREIIKRLRTIDDFIQIDREDHDRRYKAKKKKKS
jgi:hypothetical protein